MKKNDKPEDKIKVFMEICDDVSEGLSLRKSCAKHHISPKTFRKARKEIDEIGSQYTHAREDSTDALLDEMDEILDSVKKGTMKPDAARVIVDTIKWKLVKFYPKMYGDISKTQLIDDKGNGINPFEAFYKALCENKDYTR